MEENVNNLDQEISKNEAKLKKENLFWHPLLLPFRFTLWRLLGTIIAIILVLLVYFLIKGVK